MPFSRNLLFFHLLICLFTAFVSFSNSLASAEEITPSQLAATEEQTFPGLNEVVPQATTTIAQIREAEKTIETIAAGKTTSTTLKGLNESLKKLEAQYPEWGDINDWRLNRLQQAQLSYRDLASEIALPLKNISTQLQELEAMHTSWENRQDFWRDWRKQLQKSDLSIPEEPFDRALSGIAELLQQINRVSTQLIKFQQIFAPDQEIIISRLRTIDEGLNNRRKDTLRRNTFTMFEAEYYSQFNANLWSEFVEGLANTVKLSDNFLQRQGLSIALQAVAAAFFCILLVYRKKQDRPLPQDWAFIFERPLAGATFITVVLFGTFTEAYQNLPLFGGWLLLLIVIIAAMRLYTIACPQPLAKKTIQIVATVFILSKSFQIFGLPVPVFQLYTLLLCVIAIPASCYLLQKQRIKDNKIRTFLSILLVIASIGVPSAVFGYDNLAATLINGTLSTFIIIILIQMALQFGRGGINAFMNMDAIKERHFIKVLGQDEATKKLQTLLSIIIVSNSSLYILVIWKFFDNVDAAWGALVTLEYSIGNFSISVQMIILLVLVLYLTTVFSWVVQAFVDSQMMTPKKMDIGVKASLKRLAHYGIVSVGFLIAIGMAGIDLQNFAILAGALGVGIGFGLQNIVNNFVSGLILLFERPIKVGDVINIDQDWGTITKIGLRSTIFETFERAEIIVPNADLVSQKVTNWTYTNKIVRGTLPVGVKYGSPLEKVLGLLSRAAREHPEVLTYPAVSSFFVGFGDSSINFELRFWIRSIDDRLRIFSEIG
ncbi:MAG: mechanosensitive ion channel, partial [Desulfuromonadales bacterium]|nr:mechanosensitive ion channel [Desulfuromonadales bacterium]